MGIFSKEECYFCNKKVGVLTRKKLRDKKYRDISNEFVIEVK